MVLESTKVLHQSSSISYADIHIGLPNMIVCVQMVPFALLMRWAYPTKEYKLDNNGDVYTKLATGEMGDPRPNFRATRIKADVSEATRGHHT